MAAPAIHVANGRVHLALSWPQLAVAGAVLVILLVVVFQVGRRSGQPRQTKVDQLDDILAGATVVEPPPASVAAPPTPGRGRSAGPVATPLAPPSEGPPAAKPVAREPAPPRTPPPAPPPQETKAGEPFQPAPDSYYVVAQHFRLRDRQRAEAAQEFLRGKGIECDIQAGADLQLVATEQFSSEQQAESLRKRVVEAGKEYRESGGGYDFASAKARKF
jgi:hypothetical protein